MRFTDGQEAAQEFSKGLTAAVEEFNRGLPATVVTLTKTALICVLCVTVVAVVDLRSSRERAKARQQTLQQEADAKSLTANLQYLRMWYGEDKVTIARYWMQKITDTAAIWQAKNPKKDVKVIVIDHEMLWPVWDIVPDHARADTRSYDLLVSPYFYFETEHPRQPVTKDDERRFVAKDLKEAIRNADTMVDIYSWSNLKKDVFILFIFADLRGPLGPPTIEPTIEIWKPMLINGFHIIGSVCGGRPRYAIPSDSTVILQSKTYFLREKVLGEHLEDMAWHNVKSGHNISGSKPGTAVWLRYFVIWCCVIWAIFSLCIMFKDFFRI